MFDADDGSIIVSGFLLGHKKLLLCSQFNPCIQSGQVYLYMIPKHVLNELLSNPWYKRCAASIMGNCSGRITFEHAFVYAGKQINEPWAIIPLCWQHHLGNGLNKNFNRYVAIMRAKPEDFAMYPKFAWLTEKQKLLSQFEKYPIDSIRKLDSYI